MKYTIDNIPADSEFIFFWGHQPTKDGSISKTCFSQWWLSSFTVDEVEYKSAEHWMMAQKAKLFGDTAILAQILACSSPAEAKNLGRAVKNYDDQLWITHRYQIVKEGNFHKFNQNMALKQFLLDTHNKTIVEASPVDPIWGIGLAKDHKDCSNPAMWKGLNLLGFALMEVRDELKLV
jgi:ribA/ribD-fused uncharacterized protein